MDALRLYRGRSPDREGSRRASHGPLRGSTDATSVRGIVFEVDDILLDATPWRRWLLKLLGRMGLHSHYEVFYHIWDCEYAGDVYTGQRTLHEALESYLLAAGLFPAMIDEVIPALRAQRKRLASDHHALSGVVATLGRLSAMGYVLAISADEEWTGDELRRKLGQLGIGCPFASVLTSIDLHCVKPESKPYLATADAMGLPPDAVAFVGRRDDHLQGARDIGMTTVAIQGRSEVTADYRLGQFSELADFLSGPPQSRRAG